MKKISRKSVIRSKVKDSKTTVILNIDWDEFEQSKRAITDIKIPLTYEPKKQEEQGLTIELIELREAWTTKKIKRILNQISLLVLPDIVKSEYPFSIKVMYKKDGKNLVVDVKSNLLDKAPYKFESVLTENSTIKFRSFWYKKEQIIPNISKKQFEKVEEEFPFVQYDLEGKRTATAVVAKCGPVRFVFYGYPFDPTGRNLGWSDWYGKSKDQIENDLQYASGIKIYRDGFRIRPYGDQNNDWIGIGSSARAAAGKLPPNRIIGWVEISRDKNDKILDTTTREKIIENEAFQDLKDFLTESMRRYYLFAESKRQELVDRESKKKTPVMITKLSDYINKSPSLPHKTKERLISSLNEISTHLVGEEESEKYKKETLMDELSAYRNLASLGIATGSISHEVREYLKKILLSTGAIKRETEETTANKEKLATSIGILQSSVDGLVSYMQLVSSFTSNLASRKKEFRQKKDLNLHVEINDMKKSLFYLLKRWNIDLQNDIPEYFPKLRMYKADLQSILLNLISNSIKSLKILVAERQDSKLNKGIIRISGHANKNELTITFSDNGIGIPSIDRELVFDLFWTRAATHESVKSGSGLGLPIIKEIIEDYDGKITIENKSEIDKGATFKMVFPRAKV